MGATAASDAAEYISGLLANQENVNIVFAAAPSQNDFLAYLAKKDLDWKRINAFHMDEYVGLDKDAPQRFGNYLAEHIFNLVPFGSVHYIFNENKNAEQMCRDYAELLQSVNIDIVFMGVGENGHIAFNDPHVALFDDPETVKIVDLDIKCRTQQIIKDSILTRIIIAWIFLLHQAGPYKGRLLCGSGVWMPDIGW